MGNVLGVRTLFWGGLGALLCAPWIAVLSSGDQVSAWLGDTWSDSVRSQHAAVERLPVLRKAAEIPPETMFPVGRSPSWIATVRDPADAKKRLVIWLAQTPNRKINLKLIDEESGSEMAFSSETRWTWLSESEGPLLRVSLSGGLYSARYKEIHVRLPQVRTVEGEIRWIAHDENAFVGRFGWVPSPTTDSAQLTQPRMARVISSL